MAELYIPQASDWINAFEAGNQAGMTRKRDRAQADASKRLMTGDYTGAADAMAPYDMRSALQVRELGAQEQGRQHKQAVGGLLAGGKKDEAVKAAQGYGELELAKDTQAQIDAMDERDKKRTHDMAVTRLGILHPIGDLSPDEQTAYLSANHDKLLAAGWDEAAIQRFAAKAPPQRMADLKALYADAYGTKEYIEATAPKVVGSAMVRPGFMGGKPEVVYEGEQYQIVPDGGKAVPKHGHVLGDPEPAAGGAPASSASAPTGGVYDQIGQIATQGGAKPEEVSYLQRLAQVESGGDPQAQNGSSTGIFQFHPETFASVGGRDINDTTQQTGAALTLSRRDRQALQQMGVEPSDANVYIMHQQGPGGGRALLTAPPEVSAIAALTPAYGGDARMAERAVVGNGGAAQMTAGQFVDMWRQRWGGGGADRTASPAVQPYQVAANGATPGPPSGDPHGTIYGNPKPVDQWVTLPAGEAAALGPGQYQKNTRTGEVKQVSGTAPKGGGAFKLSPQDSKYLSEARTAAQQLNSTVPLVNRFRELNRQVGTGGIMGVGLMSGAAAAVDPRVAEMKSITDRLTPAMRQGMPGAASDRDVAMFQSATVGLGKPGPANAAVGKALEAGAKRQNDYVAFLEHYARENGGLLGGQEEWDAYAAANPMFDQDSSGALTVRKTQPWRDYFGVAKAADRPTSTSAAAPAPAKPAANKPAHKMTDAELKAQLGL